MTEDCSTSNTEGFKHKQTPIGKLASPTKVFCKDAQDMLVYISSPSTALYMPLTTAELCSGIGGAVKNFGRQLQSALPIVGLISRLAASSGGIGNDEIVRFSSTHIVFEFPS